MSATNFSQLRVIGTLLVLAFILLHLGLEYFQGGIQSHHILNQADLPAISNLWGLLLPLLAWFLLGELARRLQTSEDHHAGKKAALTAALLFVCTLTLALCFLSDLPQVSAIIFQGLLLGAIILPFYRAELFLGVVLGMTFAFGAILPTGVATILATISGLCQLLLWPLLRKGWYLLRPAATKSAI